MHATLTPFIGRTRELKSLRELLRTSRLLTLTGAGGSGKSRIAAELADTAERTVWWVELAALTDGALVAAEVLHVLAPSAEGGASPTDRLIDVLRERGDLLILDNCEHLVDHCAELAHTLLRECPSLHILATSREALGVPGERAWLVPPLALPQPAADDTAASADELASITQADAVRLFVGRATDHVPDFTLTTANAPAVAAICRRLDGIPLAIELAAARIRLMTPQQIRERLGDVFTLLSSGARTALPRHRTLRAAIDWSHDLLPDTARVLLRRLAVFRNGFTLDSVEAICTGEEITGAEVLDTLAILVDRSMVMVQEHRHSARYALLETIRQYAAQQLHDARETPEMERRLTDHVSDIVSAESALFITPARREAFDRLEPELDNIREVLQWSHRNAPPMHIGMVGLLWWFWYSTHHWTEARRWIDGALALPDAASEQRPRATLLFASGALHALQANVAEAQAQLTEALHIAGKCSDAQLEAYALNYMAMTYSSVGDPAAREYANRAESWFRANGDDYGLRLALLLGGMAEAAAGDTARAEQMMREAVVVARRFGHGRELAIALQTLAGVVVQRGGSDEAESLLTETLEALRDDQSYLFIARAIDFLASATHERDPHDAARRLGYADVLRHDVGARRFDADERRMAALADTIRALIGADTFDQAYAEGRGLTADEVLTRIYPPGTGTGAGAGAGTGSGSGAGFTAGAGTGGDPLGLGSDVLGRGSDLPGAASDLLGRGSDLLGRGSDLPGRGSDLLGRGSDLPGRGSDLLGRASDLPGRAGDLLGRGSDLVGPASDLLGRGSDLVGPASGLLARACDVEVRLLGGVGVVVRGREVGGWPYAKPRELLAFLALNPRGRSRGEIAVAIWPGATPAQLRNNFHVTLHHLRKTLGDASLVVLDGDRYRISEAIVLDVDALSFERQVRAATDAAELEAALLLYRGDLLEGEVAGAWRDDEQDRLRRLFTDGALRLGAMHESDGDTDAAVAAYERVLQRDALEEEAHRRLMRIWAATGDRVRAIRQYERLVAMLQDRIDAEPDEETRVLCDRIRSA